MKSIFVDFLSKKTTITGKLKCTNLVNLRDPIIKEKERRHVLLLSDNALAHLCNVSKATIREKKMNELLHSLFVILSEKNISEEISTRTLKKSK